MKSTLHEENGISTYVLEGRIDSIGAGELEALLKQAVAEGRAKIVLDLSQVQYINSAGLRTLAEILTQCRAQEGDLRLVTVNPKVERVFRIIGFDRFFKSYDSVQDAIANF
ncbi:MAG: STAS domain-containing protein [Chloroflexi bacterium]|nr:STAS domain-containing protein [Chloroflexota bacterium]